MSNEKSALDVFLDNTFISAIIGALGMACRLMLTKSKDVTVWIAIRHILAAMFTAVVVGNSASDYITTESTRYALAGVAGYAAPELLDASLKWVKGKIDKLQKKD